MPAENGRTWRIEPLVSIRGDNTQLFEFAPARRATRLEIQWKFTGDKTSWRYVYRTRRWFINLAINAVSQHVCASLPSLSTSRDFLCICTFPSRKMVFRIIPRRRKSIVGNLFYFTRFFLNLQVQKKCMCALWIRNLSLSSVRERNKILRVTVKTASVSAGMRCDVLWSSSFRWFLFSRISGRAKMFHRGAGLPPVPHWLRQQKHGKRFQFGVCLTHADDALFGHYYRCYIHRFFSSYMPVGDREDLSLDMENPSKDGRLQYI